MENLNKIIMVLLVIGLVYLILNQEKILNLSYLNKSLSKKSRKNNGKKNSKKRNKKKERKKESKNNKILKKKNSKKNKKSSRKTKKKIDLIEIDELDKLSFEDLNSNITLGTLDTSISNDGLLDELTIDTFDNELNTNNL
jgi:hypothetical protein